MYAYQVVKSRNMYTSRPDKLFFCIYIYAEQSTDNNEVKKRFTKLKHSINFIHTYITQAY